MEYFVSASHDPLLLGGETTVASLYPDPSMPGIAVYLADILLSSSSHFLRWCMVQFVGCFPSVTIIPFDTFCYRDFQRKDAHDACRHHGTSPLGINPLSPTGDQDTIKKRRNR